MGIRARWGLCLGLLVGACVDPSAILDGDDEDASFGGVDAKTDDRYTACQLREVLAMLNRSTTTEDSLRAALSGLRTGPRAAANLVTHRNGADGVHGTGDDDLYDDLNEIDAVAYVGPATLDRLIAEIDANCQVDLATRPYIDSMTFAGVTGGGWTRDSTELEATFAVSGVSGSALRAALLQETNGDTTFERIAENDDLGAFAYGFPLDEIPWDGNTADVRELLPFVALTIESDRFAPDRRTGEREISLGTDINDDTYFDTLGFDLLHRSLILRGRARWDNPTTIRRILIGAKAGSHVDENGIKSADKVDVRNDSATSSEVASLDVDVMRGRVSWGGRVSPVEPVRTIYELLRSANALPDIQGRQGVLLLDPMAHLRSTRMRLHLNEAPITSVRSIYDQGRTRMTEWVSAAENRLMDPTLAPADRASLEAYINLARGMMDGSILLERVNTALAAAGLPVYGSVTELDAARGFRGISRIEEGERHRILAAQIDAAYHEVAERLDDIDRVLTLAVSGDDVFATRYVDWIRSHDPVLGRKTTMEPYLRHFDALVASTSFSMRLAEFNAYGVLRRDAGSDDWEGFAPVDATQFAALRVALDLERNKIHQRQIALAGLIANALFFEEARMFYVPGSSRQTGNFIIDTTDFTDMVSHPEWIGMSVGERGIATSLPAARVFHTTLVNEVQIELGSEAAYVNRIRTLTDAIAAGTAGADGERMLEGARFVFNTYQAALSTIAQLKEDRVVRQLRRAGVRGAVWGPAAQSKGETAISILADED